MANMTYEENVKGLCEWLEAFLATYTPYDVRLEEIYKNDVLIHSLIAFQERQMPPVHQLVSFTGESHPIKIIAKLKVEFESQDIRELWNDRMKSLHRDVRIDRFRATDKAEKEEENTSPAVPARIAE